MTTTVPTLTIQRILYNQLDAATLHELAYLKRQEDGRVRARQALTPAGIDRLAEIVGNGSIPTVGFFKRWSA